MKISKPLCNALSTSLIFGLLLASTSNNQTDFINSNIFNKDARLPAFAEEVSNSNKQIIYETLKNGFDNLEKSIDFTDKGVTSAEVMSCIYPFLEDNPIYQYVTEPVYTDSNGNVILDDNGNATYTFVCKRTSDGYAKRLIVDYTVSTTEEAEEFKQSFLDKIDKMLNISNVKNVSSDVEKVLLIHDYFETEFKYDLDVPYKRAYGLFEYSAGNCTAYAYGFKYVMNILNIPCELVTSSSMNHAWNIVQIDNQWYHVDTTWDDPMPDILGSSYHKCLLVSDNELLNQGHHDWNSPYSCTSTKYDDYIWRDAKTQAQYDNGSIYYLDSSDNFVNLNVLDNTSSIMFNIPRSPWGENEGGLRTYTSVIVRNGIAYYNDNRNIYARKVDGSSDVLKIFSLDDNDYIGCNMYGLYLNDNNNFVTSIKSSATDTDNFIEISNFQIPSFSDIPVTSLPNISAINADINNDSSVNVLDFISLKNFLFSSNSKEYNQAYDVNLDGENNKIDLLLLKKRILNE